MLRATSEVHLEIPHGCVTSSISSQDESRSLLCESVVGLLLLISFQNIATIQNMHFQPKLRVEGEDKEDLGLSLLGEGVAEGALDALGIVGDAVLVKVDVAGAEEELVAVAKGLGAGDAAADGVLGKLVVVYLNEELEALEAVNLEGMLGLVNLVGLGLGLEFTDILLHDHHCKLVKFKYNRMKGKYWVRQGPCMHKSQWLQLHSSN